MFSLVGTYTCVLVSHVNVRPTPAGQREYQSEVALLSRNIVLRGNDRSEPTDTVPLQCDAATYPYTAGETYSSGFDQIPCAGTFLTGFGGHVMLTGQARIKTYANI